MARLTRISFAVAVVLGGRALLNGQGLAQAPAAESDPIQSSLRAASAPGDDYLICPDDELDIYVLDVPELSRQFRVSPGGSIALALLPGPVTAAGLTPGRLSEVISSELQKAGMVANPHVTVQVKNSRIHSVAVGGAVRRPQIYPLYAKTTLLDVLDQAEGLADDAGASAYITRGDVALHALGSGPPADARDGQSARARTVKVDLKRLMEEGDSSVNLDLYPGDRVTVQRAGIVYVVGAVNRAGGFPLRNDREGMTVMKAVALAENLKSTAVSRKAVIIRKDPQAAGQSEEIPVDLSKILSGHAPDRLLASNDILFVPDSAGKKAIRRAGDVAAQAAALAIYRVPW